MCKFRRCFIVPQHIGSDQLPPAVIYVHGGPTGQQDNDWYPAIQDFVTRGYVVMCPNYRGSTGYGKAFREANRFDLGRGDTNDVAAAADYLAREGLADPAAHRRDRHFVRRLHDHDVRHAVSRQVGSRFGAGAVRQLVHRACQRARRPAILGRSEHGRSGEGLRSVVRQLADLLHRSHHRADSVDRGRQRRALPAKQKPSRCATSSIELGRPVEMHVYADEGHILRQLDNRVDAYRKRAAFIDRYLDGLKDYTVIEVTFLGTGSAMPPRDRGNTAFTVRTENMLFLADAGPSVFGDLQRAGIDPAQIDAIFLSHGHADHILGFPQTGAAAKIHHERSAAAHLLHGRRA